MHSYFCCHSYLYLFLLLGLEIKALGRCVGLSWVLELLQGFILCTTPSNVSI